MSHHVSRRRFVAGAATGLSALGFSLPASALQVPQTTAPASEAYPAQDPQLAREIVAVSHNNPKRVQELVEAYPPLARASIDWGFGDWEAAIDAAAHVGRREIAELLLATGARPTIFSAAMMGHLDVVKAFVAARPGVQRIYGPHGITLMAHARAGGADALPVVQYLTTLGDADRTLPSAPLAAPDRDALVGRYVFGSAPRDHFVIDVQNDRLGIERPGSASRRLMTHTGELVFYPSGVPAVKIAFARQGGRITQLTVADPPVLLTARRA